MFITKVIRTLSLLFLLLVNSASYAEDKAIIVFDASGSMWAQVEGKTKIAIAKETLSNLVTDWDQSKQLGLLAYGHRKKGDCNDIETLVPVGNINKQTAISTVNKINPKGKTPISASLKMAADELKFTEDNATVILISDGKETCNADPCGTAAELEKMGINFTAHVIGFAVDKTTTKQLQCIAENTGGKYFPANNAKQLNDALKEVVEQPRELTLRAFDESKGIVINQKVDWEIINQASNDSIKLSTSSGRNTLPITGKNSKESPENSLEKGNWLIKASSGLAKGEAQVEITGMHNQLVKINLIKDLPKLTINSPDEAIAGTEIEISWDAPLGFDGRLRLQHADDKPNYHGHPTIFTKDKRAGSFKLPSVAGEYKFYFYDALDRRKFITQKTITLTPATIVITAPEQAGTGTEIDISWEIPKTTKAKLNLEPVGEKPKYHSNPHIFTMNKQANTMRLPATAGDYVLRMYNLNDRKAVAEKPLKLLEEQITLNAPNEAGTGTEIDISWDAPKTTEAKITLEPAGEKPKYYSNPHLYTKNKNQSSMRLPAVAGDYVLRWYNLSDKNIVTEHPIVLREEAITLNAPDEAGAGTEIDISWQAPKTAEAKITLEPQGEKPKFYSSFHVYTKKKNETVMRLPSTAGDYVLRYYNISDKNIVVERPIKITEQTITINAPDEALAGSEIELSWDAPKGLNSFINIQLADEKPNYNAKTYLYTQKKQSDYMRMPSAAGEYMLRWWNRKDRKIMAEKSITLTAADIQISAPETAIAGTEVEIGWQAPKGLDAFVNIQMSDEKPNYNAKRYVYTKKKTSEWMSLPSYAGEYTLRWWNKGSRDKALSEKTITLTPPEITINAPENGIEGSEIELSWEAPKGLDSFINVQAADEKPNYNTKHYLYTKRQNSGYLKLPNKAGNYKLRWWNKGSRSKPLHEQDFTIITGE